MSSNGIDYELTDKGKRRSETYKTVKKSHDYARSSGDNGPTGQGDTCMSDADPGL